jgi:hypothetical protein
MLIGEERLRFRATHKKDSDDAHSPGETRGILGSLEEDPVDESFGPWRKILLGGRASLAGRRPSSDAASTLKAASLFPEPMGKAMNRIDGQCVKGIRSKRI